jgi:hypothetical protein
MKVNNNIQALKLPVRLDTLCLRDFTASGHILALEEICGRSVGAKTETSFYLFSVAYLTMLPVAQTM